MNPDFNVYQFYKQMQVNSVILSFQGVVSQDLLSRLAASLKNKKVTSDANIGRKIFALFIELAQNVHLHSFEKSYSIKEDRPIGVGFLLVSEDDDHFVISSSNKILKHLGEAVVERCAYINGLDPEGLKRYYMEQRRQPTRMVDSPGANIGLIDMVRKSNNPIIANTYELEEEASILTISVRLNKN